MKTLLGLDIGSTNIKAAVYDENGRMLGVGTRPTPYRPDVANSDWVMYDPSEIWDCARAVIKEAQSGVPKAEAIAVTGLGMDAVPVSEAGEVLYHFISWRCRRTEQQFHRLLELHDRYWYFSKSGKQPFPYDTVNRVCWVRDEHPDIYKRAYKWLTIEDFVNWKLSGVLATDFSMANCTSLLDSASRDWSDELLEAAGIDRSKMPEIRPAGTVLGQVKPEIASSLGLKEGIPLVTGGHDYHCASLACNALTPEKLLISTGSFDCLTSTCDKAITSKAACDAGMSCECHVARDKYCLLATMLSGAVLEWWKDNFEARNFAEGGWSKLMEDAAAAKGGLYFLPHVFGCESPVADTRSRGTFLGIHQLTTQGDFLLSVLEGLSFQLRWIIDEMESATGNRYAEIIAVGGATRNKFWMQNKADILGRDFNVPVDLDEAACLGAALLAGVGAGVYANDADAASRTYKAGDAYKPDMAKHEAYNARYEIFRSIYPSVHGLNHRIADEQTKKGA
ncbi:MAG: hypothetical protein LBG12_03045 [Synergistaceae bacterium]|jgi:xylulokinase|nr:hypothetical protein [Synergistaceae bacterium]